jgi:tRNA modification GTPase
MFQRSDTIVAIATPQGRGGLGIVRLSGPHALRIAASLAGLRQPLVPRHATLARVHGSMSLTDQVVLTAFPAPHSYTGDDVVEISAHGSQLLLRAIVQAAMVFGARLAEPGEFTFRAYLNGKLDLVQAEAVRDLVDAVTPLQARAAFDQLEGTLTAQVAAVDAALLDLSARLEASMDFPEEGYHFVSPDETTAELRGLTERIGVLLADAGRGRLIREGAQVAILGRPNAGKSSLFNRLAGADRAIVTEVPGTTRDLVTERVEIEGLAVTLVDTAGIHEQPADIVEQEGMARSRAAQGVADLVLAVVDGSAPLTPDDRRMLATTVGRPRVVVINKSDLPRAQLVPPTQDVYPDGVSVSARSGEGIDRLRRAIVDALSGGVDVGRDVPGVTNVRHVNLLERAASALTRAAEAASSGTPEEFVAEDVMEARHALEEVTGARTPEDVLKVIFERFCIGK